MAVVDIKAGLFRVNFCHGDVPLGRVSAHNRGPKACHRFAQQPAAAADIEKAQALERFALVGVFVAKFADGVRVAVTGASEEGVFRWNEAEAALSANFSAAALDGLSVAADGMISDLHGSAAYRAHLVKVITGRAVKAAAG